MTPGSQACESAAHARVNAEFHRHLPQFLKARNLDGVLHSYVVEGEPRALAR